ncbi:MAG: isoprenylcysteine carboxylmethyltransferase family protein [Thermoanaerobaculia bacterium]
MTRESRSGAGPGVRIPPPLIFFAAVVPAWLLERFGPWVARVPLPQAWRWTLAGLLVVSGTALDLWAVGRFARAGTTLLPFREAQRFVVSGPYRFSRNPMYLGMTLSLASLAFLLDNVWYLAAAWFAAWVVGRFVIRREERYLEARFGEPYREYRRAVRRWVGRRVS